MKSMKKVFSIALALLLVVALAVPAFATNVTIKQPTDPADQNPTSETYKAYKIFDAVIADPTGESEGEDAEHPFQKVSYTIDTTNPFFATIQAYQENETTIFKLDPMDGDGVKTVTLNEGVTFDAAKLADELKKVITDTTPCTAFEGNTATLEKEGYYLITSSLGSKMIVDTFGKKDLTITTKNELPTIDLIITDAKLGTVAEDGKSATVSTTHEITWELTINVPETADKQIVVNFSSDSNTLQGNLPITDKDGNTVGNVRNVLQIDADTVKAAAAGDGKLVYTIKGQMGPGSNGDRKDSLDAQLHYSNYTSAKAETDIVTYKFDLQKVDIDKNQLNGAKFHLEDNDGNIVKFRAVGLQNENYMVDKEGTTETITVGLGYIYGLSSYDSFRLVEDEAPAGYNKLTAPVTLQVLGDDNVKVNGTETTGVVQIENLTGSELPSTGGIGTTIFYVVGGLLVAGAAILLVTKKRAQG